MFEIIFVLTTTILYAWEYHQVNQCFIVDIRKLYNGEHIKTYTKHNYTADWYI